jgi:PAS domain S-box-containing protein
MPPSGAGRWLGTPFRCKKPAVAAISLLRRRELARPPDDPAAFARLLNSGPTAIARMEVTSLDCVYVSPNVERVFGLPAADGTDRALLRRRIHPEDLPHFESVARQVAARREQAQLDARLECGDGVHRWVSFVLLPEVDGAGGVATLLVNLRDVDDRHRAQQEVKERQTALQAVLDASPDMITITTPDGRISLVNPAVEAVLGRKRDALLNRPAREWIYAADHQRTQAVLEALIGGETRLAVIRYRAVHSDGRLLVLESHASTLDGPDAEAAGVVAVTRDVTEYSRTEEMQQAARLAAEAANQAKNEFLSRMSHELRTPLNAVIGFAQLLELDDLPAEQSESVGQILKGGRHLLGLIDEVLDLARIETGRLKLSPEPVVVADVFADVVELVRPLASASNVQFVDWRAAEGLHVLTDRQRLTQILLNLVSNAVKYNRPGGTIRLACEHARAGCLRIDVIDTGPGIRADDLPLLFAPFERLGAEQRGVEGTGIGLALSRHLAEAMGGSLDVTTILGRGSTFSLVLPEAKGPVERYERLDGDLVLTTSPPRRGTVLHIEDNLSNLKLVERILARQGSIDVVAAMHGRLGMELAREHRPRLVLLDLHLPDMGGDDVLRQLRNDPVTRSIPVVIVSADATRGEIQRVLAAGATGYITKPIDVRELLRLLDTVLSDDGPPLGNGSQTASRDSGDGSENTSEGFEATPQKSGIK